MYYSYVGGCFCVVEVFQGQWNIMPTTCFQMVQSKNKLNYSIPASCLKSFNVFLFY